MPRQPESGVNAQAGAEGPDDEPGLSDVMLAMDVVDTLRHEERLVTQALNEDARERALIERVRASYSAQGIEVSEAAVVAGVKALKAREFAYEPPPPGLKTRLLSGWVARRRIGRGVGMVGGVGALVAAAYVGFVVLPEDRDRLAAVDETNAAIATGMLDMQSLDRRRVRLGQALTVIDDDVVAAPYRAAFERQRDAAADGLMRAAGHLESAATLTQAPRLDRQAEAPAIDSARDKLARQRGAMTDAATALDEAEAAIQRLNRLDALPKELALLKGEAVDLALDRSLDRDIEQRHDEALSALRRGDVIAAENAADSLKQTIDALSTVYTVRIVSRPGESSGIIRGPDVNPEADNFYLIVEARAGDGDPLPQPIRSEEDGSVRTVTKWGVRVPRSVFERVRSDKMDDGIIQADTVGQKRRGEIDIDYAIATSGGTIHSWEEPR